MKWIKVLAQNELPDGARQVVKVAGRDILLINHKGQVYAVDNRCPHMGASLAQGEVTEDGADRAIGIICRRHHSAFDLRTGDVKDWSPWPPGVGRVLGAISREKVLPVFPVKLQEESLWVGMEGP